MQVSSVAGPAGRLEAVREEPETEPTRLAVIAHPHPLYGGTMDNGVVLIAARRLRAQGASTLRFNFRGTGGSEGEHAGGPGEVEDLAAAVAELRAHRDGLPLLVAGYSFGAWVALEWLRQGGEADGLIVLAPPLSHYDFGYLEQEPQPTTPIALVCGEADALTPAELVAKAESRWIRLAAVHVLPDASHDLGTATGQGQLLARAIDRSIAAVTG